MGRWGILGLIAVAGIALTMATAGGTVVVVVAAILIAVIVAAVSTAFVGTDFLRVASGSKVEGGHKIPEVGVRNRLRLCAYKECTGVGEGETNCGFQGG